MRSSLFTHNGSAMLGDFHSIDVLDSTFTSNGLVFLCWESTIRIRSSTIAWNDAVGRIPNDPGFRLCRQMRFENTLIANNAAFAPAIDPVWNPLNLSMLDTLVVRNGTGLEAAAEKVYIDGNTFHDNASGLTLSDRAGFPTPRSRASSAAISSWPTTAMDSGCSRPACPRCSTTSPWATRASASTRPRPSTAAETSRAATPRATAWASSAPCTDVPAGGGARGPGALPVASQHDVRGCGGSLGNGPGQ
ncbi:hypothetical protein ACN28S_12440 [Cystobacter fuscus]